MEKKIALYYIDEMNPVRVGKYRICQESNKKSETRVWIQHDDGEAFGVPGELFEKCVEQFFNDNF